MFGNLEKYTYVAIVGAACIFFWYISKPSLQKTGWQGDAEGEKINLYSVKILEEGEITNSNRDPFQVPTSEPLESENKIETTEQIPYILLDGIVAADKDPLVNIDGKLYSEGQMYRGAKIIKIYYNRVQFDYKGKIIEKTMNIPNMETLSR